MKRSTCWMRRSAPASHPSGASAMSFPTSSCSRLALSCSAGGCGALVDDSRVTMPGGLRVLGGDVCSEQSPPPLVVVPLALSSCCSLGVRLRSASLAASLAECRGRCCRDAAACCAAGDGVPSLPVDAGSPTDLKVPCEGASWSPLAFSVAIHTSTIWPICALLGSVGHFDISPF